jgi:hypothetical protein
MTEIAFYFKEKIILRIGANKMINKPDWEKTKKRLTAFWDLEVIDRCCIAAAAPINNTFSDVSTFAGDSVNPNDAADLLDYWTNPERILKRNLNRMENTYFGGDAFPEILLNFGASGHAAYFGSKPTFNQDTIWFSQIINDWDKDELYFNTNEVFYKNQLEIAEYLTAESKGRYMMGMPDNAGAIDALAHLRGSENLLMDLVDNPDIVKNAVKKICDVWKETSQKFYDITAESNGGGSFVGWMDVWAPCKQGPHLQCDLSVMISPKQYQEFVVPELINSMEWLDYPTYHFDGIEQIRHLDMLLSLKKLRMIQWTHVAGQPSPAEFIPVFRRIQQAGKNIIIWCPYEDVPKLIDNLSAKGLYIHTFAKSIAEADAVVNYALKNSR